MVMVWRGRGRIHLGLECVGVLPVAVCLQWEQHAGLSSANLVAGGISMFHWQYHLDMNWRYTTFRHWRSISQWYKRCIYGYVVQTSEGMGLLDLGNKRKAGHWIYDPVTTEYCQELSLFVIKKSQTLGFRSSQNVITWTWCLILWYFH